MDDDSPQTPELQPRSRRIPIGRDDWRLEIGGGPLTIIAGPCAVESLESLRGIAASIVNSGASALRGGAFKPRTSPYSFQGIGVDALQYLARVREEFGVPVVTEALDVRHVHEVAGTADVLQVGARNMTNVPLLREIGSLGMPVLLKRGFAATIDELLHAADYLVDAGTDRILLCERGIRTFETSTRFTLDIGAVAVLRERCDFPIVVDPSHAAGDARYVASLARAAVAAGADAVLIEVHHRPEHALSDGAQSITTGAFTELARELTAIAQACGRSVARPMSVAHIGEQIATPGGVQ